MLEIERSPSVGSPGALQPLRAEEVAKPVARDHHLADDLTGGEVAHQPLRAGVAERAGQRAADLAGEAERAAVGLGDVDALDLVRTLAAFAGQAKEPLAGAVGRHLLRHHLGTRQREVLRQHGAQLLRHAGHGVEVARAAHIDPVPELLHAHLALLLGDAGLPQRVGQFGARQPDQRRHRRRDVELKRRLLDEGVGLRGGAHGALDRPPGGATQTACLARLRRDVRRRREFRYLSPLAGRGRIAKQSG